MKTPLLVIFALLLLSVHFSTISAQEMSIDDYISRLETYAHELLERVFVEGEPNTEHLVREDGYIYTIDLTQLMIYFALKDNWERYSQLRELSLREVYINSDDDPYTQGFVAWRYNPDSDVALDASGTTEALRLAKALWIGATMFEAEHTEVRQDRETVALILDGYSRHSYVYEGVWENEGLPYPDIPLDDSASNSDNSQEEPQDVPEGNPQEDEEASNQTDRIWVIRNYLNLETKAFANNTYLVDYDPDFLWEVIHSDAWEGEFANDAVVIPEEAECEVLWQNQPANENRYGQTMDITGMPLDEVARRSYCLYQYSLSESKLFYDIIQPEITTVLPDAGIIAFSPNDVIQLSNSCNIAETAAMGRPDLASLTLDFAFEALPEQETEPETETQTEEYIPKYFNGTTGDPISGDEDDEVTQENRAGSPDYNCLVRLAILLENEAAYRRFFSIAEVKWKESLGISDFDTEPVDVSELSIELYDIGDTLLTLYAVQHYSPDE